MFTVTELEDELRSLGNEAARRMAQDIQRISNDVDQLPMRNSHEVDVFVDCMKKAWLCGGQWAETHGLHTFLSRILGEAKADA